MDPVEETPQSEEPPDTMIDINKPDEEVVTDEPVNEEPPADTRVDEVDRETRAAAVAKEGSRHRDESEDEYGRRVQGRINREIALRRRVERRLDESESSNREMRDRLAVIERRQSAEDITSDAKKRLVDINAKIAALKLTLAAAIEAGDTVKQLDLNIEMGELIADKKIIERRSEYQAEQVRAAPAAPTEAADPEATRIARATSKWQKENRNWWNLNRFREMKADAIAIDKVLRAEVADGELDMEEYSDEYFAELSTRLKQNYPDLDVRGVDGEAVEAEQDPVPERETRRPTQRKPASGGMGTSDRRRGAGSEVTLAQQGRVRLGAADYAQMREYSLDPNNKEHVKRFAQERMRTILTDAGTRRGGGR